MLRKAIRNVTQSEQRGLLLVIDELRKENTTISQSIANHVDASQVDTSKAGTYEVTYTYDGVTSKATITVKDKQTAVNVYDSTIYVGDTWKAEDNFDSALDKDGNAVNFKDVTVEGTVDTTKAGTYEVTYSYDGVTSTAMITNRDKEKDSTPNNDNNKGQDSQNTGEKVLPQTGEQSNTIWTLAGFLTVLLSLIYLVKKRKKSH